MIPAGPRTLRVQGKISFSAVSPVFCATQPDYQFLTTTVNFPRIFSDSFARNQDAGFSIRSSLFRRHFASTPVRMGSRIGGKVFLTIYGNGSANKMPGFGCSVLPTYEFFFRYPDGLAEFLMPSDDTTLFAGNAQQGRC